MTGNKLVLVHVLKVCYVGVPKRFAPNLTEYIY